MTPWTVAHQAPLFMEFSRQAYWSGLPFPSPEDFPTQGSNLALSHCRLILYQFTRDAPYHELAQIYLVHQTFSLGNLKWENVKHLRIKNDYYSVHSCLVTKPCPTLWDPVDCNLAGYSVHGISQARTGMGCHFLLQGIILTQGLSLCLLHCGLILQNWVTRKPYIPPKFICRRPKPAWNDIKRYSIWEVIRIRSDLEGRASMMGWIPL